MVIDRSKYRIGQPRKPVTNYMREVERSNQGALNLLANRSYFAVSLWVDLAGDSHLFPLVAPNIPQLYLVRIAAFHSDEAVAGGSTILRVSHETGVSFGDAIGSLNFPPTAPAFTSVSADLQAPVAEDSLIAGLKMIVDGGHRQIFATAYFAQIPTR